MRRKGPYSTCSCKFLTKFLCSSQILRPPILFFKTKAEEIWEHSKEWNEERACSGERVCIDI
jgi:hypothetical protein